jgi:ABC-type Fe3+ transport system permease subunit
MIKQSDIEARLRLLRYGLLVVVIVAFVVSISYPVVALHDKGQIGDFIGRSLLYSVVVAVVCVAIYFAYSYILQRTMGKGEGEENKTEGS